MNKLKNDIIENKIALIVVILYLALMWILFHTLCPFYAIFHFPCPACGLTRACLLILTGRFTKSLGYNPTAIFWIISISCFIIDRYIKPLKIKPFPYMFIITSLVTIIWYFIRIIVFK